MIDVLKQTWTEEQQSTTMLQKIFIFDLEASEAQQHGEVETLIKDYPNDVDINLAGEQRHFHVFVKRNYPGKEQVYHKDLYEIRFLQCSLISKKYYDYSYVSWQQIGQEKGRFQS